MLFIEKLLKIKLFKGLIGHKMQSFYVDNTILAALDVSSNEII